MHKQDSHNMTPSLTSFCFKLVPASQTAFAAGLPEFAPLPVRAVARSTDQ